VLPNVGVEIQTRDVKSQKKERPGGPNLSCTFSTLPLLVCVCLYRRYLRKEYIADIKIELSGGVFTKLRFGSHSNKFGNPLIYAILAQAVEVLFKSISV